MTTISKKQASPSIAKTQEQDLDLADQFQATQEHLVDAQNQLAALLVASATSPLVELQLEARRKEAQALRDELLRRYGSIALTWILRGGKVRFAFPDAPADYDRTKEPKSAPERTDDPPTPVPLLADALPTADALSLPAEIGDSGLAEIDETLKALKRVVPLAEPRIVESRLGDKAPMRIETVSSDLLKQRPQHLDHERLHDTLTLLGRPPGELTDSEALWDELYGLLDACSPANVAVWVEFPKDIQKSLVGMVVSRSRHIQDEIPEHLRTADLDAELDRLFSGMTAFSKREQPGFVFGLQRHHHSVGETWAADAFRWWDGLTARLPDPSVLDPDRALQALKDGIEEGGGEDEVVSLALAALDAGAMPDDPTLVKLMTPHMEKLRKHTKFKRLRKAIRDALEADDAFKKEMGDDAPALPKTWPFRHKVQGKNVVIVSGDLGEEARHRIQNTFKFASVDWINTDVAEGIQPLPRTIRSGNVEIVIALNRFLATGWDKQARTAAKGSNVPWVEVAGPYTVTAIREAIEQQLSS
jgi:hypothetical protein